MGSNTFVFESRPERPVKNTFFKDLNTFLKYLTFLNTFSNEIHCQYQHSVSRSYDDVMAAKLITFTATSPNSANYWWRHVTAVVPHGPGSNHNFGLLRARGWISTWQWPISIGQYIPFVLQLGSRLFWFPGWLWSRAVTLPHKILAVISIVSHNIDILLWTSLPLWVDVFESVVTVM